MAAALSAFIFSSARRRAGNGVVTRLFCRGRGVRSPWILVVCTRRFRGLCLVRIGWTDTGAPGRRSHALHATRSSEKLGGIYPNCW